MKVDHWKVLKHVFVAGQWVAVASRADLVDAARYDCEIARRNGRVRPRLIFDCNGQGIAMARNDAVYRANVGKADVVHADGEFIVKASRFLCSQGIAERSATTDMIHDVAKMAARHGFTFYLLGGTEEANRECAIKLSKMYPELKVVGRNSGYFRGSEQHVIDDINMLKPDILWVGLGKPYEQQFCIEFRDRIDAVWIVTCGGCFNFITGDYSRAPDWMQKFALEWVYRMAADPRRLGMRYLTTTPVALLEIFFNSSRNTQSRSFSGP